ncbi:unnamed protein product [Paramecium octaurelia]|uniref:4-alpha-hydroxy-tetrahydropterin dehydratase n=1 Tax=Paramecium octaurelia TaxID=43137 RepID=A0A8S1UJ83_PAROT|nr:unnamed protein product [Paramecium octaurelia]
MIFSIFKFRFGTIQTNFPKLSFKVLDFQTMKERNPTLISDSDIQTLCKMHSLNSTWKITPQKLYREIKFNNFKEAFSFMNQVAIFSEQIDHHPDWENVYNLVKINLNTHDIGGISIKDIFLAYAIDTIAMNVRVKSAESTNDTRILEVAKIAESWNLNFDQFHRMIETDSRQI